MMIRHIPHAPGARLPRNLGPSVFSFATAYGLEHPEIYVFPLAGEPMDGVIVSLQTALKGAQIMLVETADILQSRGIGVPIPLEMLTVTQELDASVYPLAGNTTFTDFKERGWPFQDFLSAGEIELSRIPDASAMKVLKISRWIKALAALLFIGVLSSSGYKVWQEVMSETWQYHPQNQQAKTAALNKKLKEYKTWDNLLLDRSKAWQAMELVSQMVPSDGSIVLKGVEYSIKKGESGKKKKAGFEKIWEIQGSCDDKGIQQFEDYNLRDGKKIAALFTKVAALTGNQAYLPDVKGRDLVVKFSRATNRSGRGRSNVKRLPYQFSLTIVQSFSPDDIISIQ
jgi:hypothetical protein